jgi:hypothetical protein
MLVDGSSDPGSIEPAIATMKVEGVQFNYLGSSALLEKETDRFTGAAIAAGIGVLMPYAGPGSLWLSPKDGAHDFSSCLSSSR